MFFRCLVVWLQDVDLVQEALTFYRLMVVWLTGLVGGFRMPLPAVCPMEFASMPEHFVEDVMELLLYTSRIPRALDGVNLVSQILKARLLYSRVQNRLFLSCFKILARVLVKDSVCSVLLSRCQASFS